MKPEPYDIARPQHIQPIPYDISTDADLTTQACRRKRSRFSTTTWISTIGPSGPDRALLEDTPRGNSILKSLESEFWFQSFGVVLKREQPYSKEQNDQDILALTWMNPLRYNWFIFCLNLCLFWSKSFINDSLYLFHCSRQQCHCRCECKPISTVENPRFISVKATILYRKFAPRDQQY